jgi:hypothetical protein
VPTRWFRISFAENAFRRFIAASNRPLEALRMPDALTLVAGFYADHRAQHARINDGGDRLLWQWGPDADATSFTVDLTRQLIREGDDQPIVQLTLTLAYRWTPGRRALGRGHSWCSGPSELPSFEREVRSSDPYRAIAGAAPTGVMLRTEVL